MEQILFNTEAWRHTCENLAVLSSKNCGLSHDVYVRKFSAEVNTLLMSIPEQHQLTAVEIARKYDYATSKEIEEGDSWNAEEGFCIHGIDPYCCPAGCGDLDDI